MPWLGETARKRGFINLKYHRYNVAMFITPSRVSGAERYVLFLTRELLGLGHNITLITSVNTPFVDYARKELSEFLGGGRLSIELFGRDGKLNYFAYRRVRNIILRVRADIIHSHLSTATFFASIMGRWLSIPVVSTVHAIGDLWYYNSDKLICVSQAVYNYLAGKGIDRNKLIVITNGIPLSSSSPPPPPESQGLSNVKAQKEFWGIPDNNIVIACIGHFSKKKGHRVLLRAFSKLKIKNKSLFLCGEGSLESSLRREAKLLGISPIFAGFQDPIESVLPIFDIVVLASISGEGLPISLLEAMSFSLPIVASSISGIYELIEDGINGYLFSPGDVDALSRALCLLVDNPQRRQLMGIEAKKRVYAYDIKANALKVHNLYKALLLLKEKQEQV